MIRSASRILLALLIAGAALWPSPASANSQGVVFATAAHGAIFWTDYRFLVNAAVVDGKGTLTIQRFKSAGTDVAPWTAVQAVESMEISVEGTTVTAWLHGTCVGPELTGPCTSTLTDGGSNYQAGIPINDYKDAWSFHWGSHSYQGIPGQGDVTVIPR